MRVNLIATIEISSSRLRDLSVRHVQPEPGADQQQPPADDGLLHAVPDFQPAGLLRRPAERLVGLGQRPERLQGGHGGQQGVLLEGAAQVQRQDQHPVRRPRLLTKTYIQ